MNCNEIVYENIKKLIKEQNVVFALSCIKRTKHFPQLFFNSDTYGIEHLNKIIPNNTIENILNKIINKITDKIIYKDKINKT
jgi:hypothetical protein